MIKGCVLIYNRDLVKGLLVDLQNNFDASMCKYMHYYRLYTINKRISFSEELLGRTRHYVAMNKQIALFSRIDIAVMTSSINSICFGPLFLVFYHYLKGDLTNEMYRQPVGLVYN